MDILFVVLVYFSGGDFQGIEVVEMGRASIELQTKDTKNSCEIALAKPLAALRSKPTKKLAARKVHYACMGGSQLGSFESIIRSSQVWPSVGK